MICPKVLKSRGLMIPVILFRDVPFRDTKSCHQLDIGAENISFIKELDIGAELRSWIQELETQAL
jgi:hypothetical protein